MNAPKMMMGAAAALLLPASIQAQVASPAAPALQPIKPWVVHFDDTECYAERTYGTPADPVILGFRPSPDGDTYELLVARRQKSGRYAQQLKGSVDFGQHPIKAWLLRYGVKESGYTVDKYRLEKSEMGAAATAPTVLFRNEARSDERFTLVAMPEVLKTLDRCNDDLRHYWNMTPSEQDRIAKPAVGDVRRFFNAGDYPDAAMDQDQEGSAQFLVFVNEKGGVAACHVLKASGSAALDGMGCQVIRERARFKPAYDAKGQPIRSSVVTPDVVWRIEG
jgi:TonB family protein